MFKNKMFSLLLIIITILFIMATGCSSKNVNALQSKGIDIEKINFSVESTVFSTAMSSLQKANDECKYIINEVKIENNSKKEIEIDPECFELITTDQSVCKYHEDATNYRTIKKESIQKTTLEPDNILIGKIVFEVPENTFPEKVQIVFDDKNILITEIQ